MRLKLIEPRLERQHRFAPQAEDAHARITGLSLGSEDIRITTDFNDAPETTLGELLGVLDKAQVQAREREGL